MLDAKHVREAILDVGPNDIIFAGGCVGDDGNADEGTSCSECLVAQVVICKWICHWTRANVQSGLDEDGCARDGRRMEQRESMGLVLT